MALALPAKAQLIKHYGVVGGLTSARLVGEPNDPYRNLQKRRVGFHLGGFVEWFNIPHVSAVTQICYIQKGAGLRMNRTTYDQPLGTGLRNEYSRLDYLSIPVLVKATFPISTIMPYALAGPQVDILIDYEEDADFTYLYEKFDNVIFGFSVGAGIQSDDLFPLYVFIEARFNIDLVHSYEQVFYSDYHLKIKNSSFDISVGIGF